MVIIPKYIFTCIQIDEICFIDCNYFYVMSCDIIKRITLSWISFLVTHAIISMLFLSLPLFLLLLWNLRALKESNYRVWFNFFRIIIQRLCHHMLIISQNTRKGYFSSYHTKCIHTHQNGIWIFQKTYFTQRHILFQDGVKNFYCCNQGYGCSAWMMVHDDEDICRCLSIK